MAGHGGRTWLFEVRRLAAHDQGQSKNSQVWVLSFFNSRASASNPSSGAILRLLNKVIQMLRDGKVVTVKALKTSSFNYRLDILRVLWWMAYFVEL